MGFMGFRTGGKSKTSASAMYKKSLTKDGKAKEESPDDKYKKIMEEKMYKMMEEAIMGRKKAGPRLPGTKAPDESGPPPELSKNAKLMLQMLALRKVKKEAKDEKKRVQKEKWKESAKKRDDAYNKLKQQQADDYLKQQQAEAAAAAAAAAAPKDDGGWW